MANTQKFRAHESLNVETAADWQVQTIVSVTANAADAMIFQTEKQLKEFGEKLSADKKKPIEDALTELKKSYESKDLDTIDAAMEKMNTAWTAASEEMYKASQEATSNNDNPDANKNDASDDVTDVDFEEVKDDSK